MSRRRDSAHYLFHDFDLHASSERRREQMKQAIDNADPNAIRNGDVDTLTAAYVSEFALDGPELIEGAISVDVEEAQVDVRYDPMRAIFDRSRPVYVPGIRAVYYVPYRGDRNLFLCKPTRWTTLIPAVSDLGSE